MHKKFNNVYLWVVGLQAVFIFFLKLPCVFKYSETLLYHSCIQKAMFAFVLYMHRTEPPQHLLSE